MFLTFKEKLGGVECQNDSSDGSGLQARPVFSQQFQSVRLLYIIIYVYYIYIYICYNIIYIIYIL